MHNQSVSAQSRVFSARFALFSHGEAGYFFVGGARYD